MKKSKPILFLVMLAAGVLILTGSITAQVKSQSGGEKPSYYEYLVGTKVSASLMKGCAMLEGRIQQVGEHKITVAVEDRFLTDNFDQKTLQINYAKPSVDVIPYSQEDSPWRFVDVSQGSKLVIFDCPDKSAERKYQFITSDEKLIAGIKKSVLHFIDYRQNPETLLRVVDLVKTENDQTFIGYIFSFLSNGGAIEHSDQTVLLLSQLLETDKLPKIKMLPAIQQVSGLLSGDFVFPISQTTKDTALSTLMRVGSSKKNSAEVALIILARVAKNGKVDLKPFVNNQNKAQLRENLRALPFEKLPAREREKLEAFLVS